MLNLDKIKKFMGDRENFEEVKLVTEANQYITYEKMAIDDKKAVSVVDGTEYPIDEENPMWPNTRLRYGHISRVVNQRVSYAFGRKCTFSENSDQIGVLFDMNTIRKCAWYIATHGRAFLEVCFNVDGTMCGIKAHDAAHCFEFHDAETLQHGWVIIEEVDNEFGMKNADNDSMLVRIIEENKPQGAASTETVGESFTITQYLFAKNELTEVSYIPELTVNRLHDDKIRKFNGDIVMELFTDPFKIGVYKKVSSISDEFDFMSSSNSDYLKKSPRSPIVVKGYGTTLSELVTNVQTYNVIPVQADGDVELLKAEQDISAAQKHLELIEDSIRDQTGWVKSELGNVGYSGAALRMRYAELDIHAQHLQETMTEAFDGARLYIVAAVQGTSEDVSVSYDSDVMVNETDTVTNCVNSLDILSRRTILENHPFVRSVDVEIERLEEEGRPIYEIGESEEEDSASLTNETGTLDRAEDGTELDPSQEMNLTNKQREQMANDE